MIADSPYERAFPMGNLRKTLEGGLRKMNPQDVIPGRRVEISDFGEGTVVGGEEDEVEIAVSEIETVRVRPERLDRTE